MGVLGCGCRFENGRLLHLPFCIVVVDEFVVSGYVLVVFINYVLLVLYDVIVVLEEDVWPVIFCVGSESKAEVVLFVLVVRFQHLYEIFFCLNLGVFFLFPAEDHEFFSRVELTGILFAPLIIKHPVYLMQIFIIISSLHPSLLLHAYLPLEILHLLLFLSLTTLTHQILKFLPFFVKFLFNIEL